MAVMRLHRGLHGYMKRARSQSMPQSEALPQACFGYTGERAHVGRVLLQFSEAEACAASWLRTTLETCGSISRLCVVQQFAKIVCCLQVGFVCYFSPYGVKDIILTLIYGTFVVFVRCC